MSNRKPAPEPHNDHHALVSHWNPYIPLRYAFTEAGAIGVLGVLWARVRHFKRWSGT